MKQRLGVRAIVLLVFLVVAIGLWFSEDTVPVMLFGLFGISVAVVLSGIAVWDRHIWRCRWIQKLMVETSPVDIGGTWHGRLESSWIDPATGNPRKPKTVFLAVRQTSREIQVTLLTEKQVSSTIVAGLSRSTGSAHLSYIYSTEPTGFAELENSPHHGAGLLHISGRPVEMMSGKYWTSRESRGELILVNRSKTVADSYAAAARLFDKIGP